jgi:hypothetical protein
MIRAIEIGYLACILSESTVCPLVLLDSTSTHAAFTPHVLLRFRRSCPFEQCLLLSGCDDIVRLFCLLSPFYLTMK